MGDDGVTVGRQIDGVVALLFGKPSGGPTRPVGPLQGRSHRLDVTGLVNERPLLGQREDAERRARNEYQVLGNRKRVTRLGRPQDSATPRTRAFATLLGEASSLSF